SHPSYREERFMFHFFRRWLAGRTQKHTQRHGYASRCRPQIESLEDRCTAAVFTVTNNSNDGGGSLRWAMDPANTNPGMDTINFNSGQQGSSASSTISTVLPAIMDVVLIDGYTQGGMNGAGRPWVELNGNGLAGSGLVTLVGGVTMRGLAINRFGIDGIFLG